MNISKKILSLLLVVATLLCFMNIGVAVSAATPDSQTIKAGAGETVTVKFSLDNVYGSNGDITYSNRDLFSSVTPSVTPSSYITESRYIVSNFEPTNIEITLKVTIKANATVGSKSTITFTYERVDDVMGNGPSGLVKTITVEVIDKTPSTPSNPSSTPSNPSSNPSTPSNPVKCDLTELNKQIGIAQGLKASDYTSESWGKLAVALNAAINARNATSQASVDAAATALKNAIAGLVRINGDLLRQLLDQVKELLKKDNLGAVTDALIAAIDEAEAALNSGNQDAINKAYDKLSAAFEAYKDALKKLSEGQIVEVEKEVEVEPDYPFCNIWLHILWLILFIVSALVNVAFIVLTILHYKKRKKFDDNMPLVDYNINED